MTNPYSTLNYDRHGKEEKVALWQNRIMRKVREYGCTFKVERTSFPAVAVVRYADRYETDIPPAIQISSHYASPTSKSGVMATLHELGHVIDYRRHGNCFYTYLHMNGTGEIEVSAWENAFRLARQIGFSKADLEEMHEYALQCLWTYSNGHVFSSPNDFHCNFFGAPMRWEEAIARIDKALTEAKESFRVALYSR